MIFDKLETLEDLEVDQKDQGILGRSLTAGKWYAGGIIIQKIIQFGSFFLLARILIPSDFGVLSIILIVPGILDFVTSMYFESAVVQKKGDPTEYLNAIWTFNIIRSLLVVFCVYFFAPIIANFFNIGDKIIAIRLSGLFILIPNLTNIGQMLFIRELKYGRIFVRDFFGYIVYALVTITIALMYHSYWALVLGSLAQLITTALMTYVLYPYRPRFTNNISKLRDLLPFTLWIYGQNVLLKISGTIENTFVGKIAGANGLGLYTKSVSLSGAPTSPIASIVGTITFPAYSRIQDVGLKISDATAKSMDLLLSVAIPYAMGILIAGHLLVQIFLGHNWLGIIPLLKIIVVGTTCQLIASNIGGPLLNALAKSKAQFRIRLINALVFIGSLIVLTPSWGVIGAAMSVAISGVVVLIVVYLELRKHLEYSDKVHILKSTLTIGSGTLIIGAFAKMLLSFNIFNTAIGFMVLALLALVTYVAFLFVTYRLLKIGPFGTLRTIALSFK